MIKNLRIPIIDFFIFALFGFFHFSVEAQYCGNLDRKSSAYFQCEQLRILKQQESRQLNEQVDKSANEIRNQERGLIDGNLNRIFKQEADLLIKQYRLRVLEAEVRNLIKLHEQTKSDYCSNFGTIEKAWIRAYSRVNSSDNFPQIFSDIDNFISLYSEALQISCNSDKTKLLEFLVHTLNSRDFNRSISSSVILSEFTNFNTTNYLANKVLGISQKPVAINDILLSSNFNESFFAIKFLLKHVVDEVEATTLEIEKIKQSKK
jgi:hypothetical protein